MAILTHAERIFKARMLFSPHLTAEQLEDLANRTLELSQRNPDLNPETAYQMRSEAWAAAELAAEKRASWTLADFRIGDKLILTSRTATYEQRSAAIVERINYRGNGEVGFGPSWHGNDGLMTAGQGSFKPEQVGKKPYGLCVAVEIVERGPETPPKPLQGFPGRSY